MTNWNTYKLEEVISDFIDYRGKTPPKVSSGIPLITAKVVKSGSINEPNEFVPEAIYDKWMTRGIPEYGDVLLTTEAPLGEVAQLKFKHKVVVGQRLITLRGKNDILDNTYLKYSLQTKEMQARMEAVATGTTVIGIKSAELRKVEIDLPDLPSQYRIAEILSALDDKIELNRRMNQTLEQMAQTLFRQYFVDGIDEDNLPEGWREGKLGDIVDVKGGTTPSTKQPEFWNGSINWTSPKDLSSVRFPVLLDTEKKITEAGLKKISSGLLPVGTLLLSSRAPIGYLAITQIPVAINQGYIAILCEKGYSNYFMLFWLKENMSTIIQNANGSTFLEISKSVFKSIDLSIPPVELVEEFDAKVDALFQKLVLNEKESIKLTQLRDTLLPKLMSGEIDVMQIKPEELHEPVLS
ncbi:restriction endonuclease subunit S [Pontibacter kalidii]|uniref:restriction endonuclease subunit S n=1 Tax=Pontibacter kalidii TaxID=2592049 RepID=UPI00225456DE|nr:restriction endonuclease subunit S [Pontibacter kalidii]